MERKGFSKENGKMLCDSVPVEDLVREYGTPLYIYSGGLFEENLLRFKEAFKELSPLICYSVKSNSCGALLQLVKQNGLGADIVSGGELYRALRVGIPADSIVFAGVGKTRSEIEEALEAGVYLFNVESIPEAQEISEAAGKLGKTARIAIRVNPDVKADTHKHITTGTKENKFGIDLEVAEKYFQQINELPHLELIGVHCHIGSQITDVAPYVNAMKRVVRFVNMLREEGIHIKVLNLGGGYGVAYHPEENPLDLITLGKELKKILEGLDCQIIMEPGRFISAPAGILATRVIYVKEGIKKTFVIIDGAVSEFIRPVLYDGYHEVEPIQDKQGRKNKVVDVVGPICESGDFFAKDRELQEVQSGEYLAVRDTGAYGFAMASNYNSRPFVSEVVVYDRNHYLVRQKNTYADLVKDEILVSEWQ